MTVYVSTGVTFERETVASPLTFSAIVQVSNISSLGQTRSLIDVTNLSSTLREYKKALKDGQEMTITIQYDPDDTQHAALLTDLNSDTAGTYRVTFTDSPAQTVTFNGLVTGLTHGDMNPDSVITADVTIKPTGSFTYA